MPRSIWNGAISFGLVNVPVALYSAIEQKDVHSTSSTGSPGSGSTTSASSRASNKEVEYADIVKGYESPKGST